MSHALRNPRFWIGMLISLVALGIVANGVDRDEVAAAFRDANYWMLLPALAMAFLSLLLRTKRWQTLFHPLRPPVGELFGILMVGYTVTAVLPLRLGDIARVYLLGQLSGISKVRAAATVIVERVLDVSTVILIMAALIPFVPIPREAQVAMTIGIVVVSLLGLSIGLSWVWREAILGLLSRRSGSSNGRVWSRVEQMSGSAIDGFSVLGSKRATAAAAGHSAATWLAGGVTMWAMLQAFSLPSTPTAALFILAMSALAMVLPSSPGFVGVYHAVLVESLVSVYDAPRGAAVSFAILTHAVMFLPPVILGVAYLVKEHRIWDALLRWGRGEDAPAERQPSPPEHLAG